MTSKQRRMVKREFGVTVPPWVPLRCLVDEVTDECCLHVFPVSGREPWVPFGAKRSEPGELDNHDRPTMMYYFDRLKSRKEQRKAQEDK